MENSNISWTDNTFNGWIGCTEKGDGCTNCYAKLLMETRFKRVKWGAGQPRLRTSEETWRKPLRWNAAAEKAGKRVRVFSASLADVFDREVPDAWRDDLFTLIRQTPNLDWQVLSKRVSKAVEYAANIQWPENMWIGTSIENQKVAWRAQVITSIAAPVHFLSVEPLLGPVELDLEGIDWVIAGGESGPHARPMEADWARSVRDQCAAAGVPFFFKQWGGRNAAAAGCELDGVIHHAFPTPVRRGPVPLEAVELKEAA